MRDISPALADHLTGDLTTLALCWRLMRRDGIGLGFTAHDRDLLIDGELYRSAPSIDPSAIDAPESGRGALEIGGVLSHGAITAADLILGRFDHARVLVFLVNWADPGAGRIVLAGGSLGEVQIEGSAFQASLAPLSLALDLPLTSVYSPECRADLGDSRCAVALHGLALRSAVTAVGLDGGIACAGLNGQADWYAYGRLRWLSGANVGFDGEVLASTTTAIRLRTLPPRPIVIGDRFELRPGCDKRFDTCRGKFGNAHNFQGEPHVPGVDSLINYPGL